MIFKETGYSLLISVLRTGLILVLCLFVLSGCKNEVVLENPVMKEAKRINYKCPTMIDQITRMDSVTVLLADSIFQFCYTLVDQSMGSMDVAGLLQFLKPKLFLYAQDHASMAVQRKHRLTLAFLYRDKNGAFVTEIIIKPEEYIRKQNESLDSSD
jgi:hypothetical protein